MQNKLNSQKRLNFQGKYIEDVDQTFPMQYARDQNPESRRRGSGSNLLREQDVDPQPTWALTEFVKHVTDPLVDKGWNLHLKFGKGGPQKEEFIQGTTTPKTLTKAMDKEKSVALQKKNKSHLEWVLVEEVKGGEKRWWWWQKAPGR